MVLKVEYRLTEPRRRRLAVLGRDVDFWTPPVAPTALAPTQGLAVGMGGLGSIVVNEDFPEGAFLAQPTDDVRSLALTHGTVELADGNYGDQVLGSLPGAYIFSRTGNATFDGAYNVGPFLSPSDGITLRNFTAQRYQPAGGPTRFDGVKESAGIINMEGTNSGLFLDMRVGLSPMNSYCLKCSNVTVEGGEIFDCHRYGFSGGGSGNTIRGVDFNRISWNTNEVQNPEETIGERGNRGCCKIATSGGDWLIEDCNITDYWNGFWFDIRNEPSTIRRIHGIRGQEITVFLEASYDSSATGRNWIIEDITAEDQHQFLNPNIPNSWPAPAIVVSSITPDVDIRRISGDGTQAGTVGLLAWDHNQLNHSNTSRMGIAGITIEDAHFEGIKYGFGWEGDVRNWAPNGQHEAPTFINCTVDHGGSVYRWQGSDINATQMEAKL